MRELEPRLLSELFIQHLKAKLVEEAIAAIRPAIRDAVADVVVEMAPAVQTYLDHLKNEMVVQIVTKEIPAPWPPSATSSSPSGSS